jgi:hypothetical protein
MRVRVRVSVEEWRRELVLWCLGRGRHACVAVRAAVGLGGLDDTPGPRSMVARSRLRATDKAETITTPTA